MLQGARTPAQRSNIRTADPATPEGRLGLIVCARPFGPPVLAARRPLRLPRARVHGKVCPGPCSIILYNSPGERRGAVGVFQSYDEQILEAVATEYNTVAVVSAGKRINMDVEGATFATWHPR